MCFEHSTKYSAKIMTNFKTKIHKSPCTGIKINWETKHPFNRSRQNPLRITKQKNLRNVGISSQIDPCLGKGELTSSKHWLRVVRPKLVKGLPAISQGKRDERWYPRTQKCFKMRYTRRKHFLNDFLPQNSLPTFLKSKCIPSVKDPTLPSHSGLGIPNDATPAFNSQIKSWGVLVGPPFSICTCRHLHNVYWRLAFHRWISHILYLPHSKYSWAFPPTPICELKREPEKARWIKRQGSPELRALTCGIAIRFQIIEIRGQRSEFKCQLDVLLRRLKYLTFRSAFCFL